MNKLIKSRGFTLIELIVVIAILGILAAVLVPSISNYVSKAEEAYILDGFASIYGACNEIIIYYDSFGDPDQLDINMLVEELNNRSIIVGVECPFSDSDGDMFYVNYVEQNLTISYYEGLTQIAYKEGAGEIVFV